MYTCVLCISAVRSGHFKLSTAFAVQQPVGEHMSLAAQRRAAIRKHCICNMQHFLALAVLL